MNTISFYMPLDGKCYSDLGAFITECLLLCGFAFEYTPDNGELTVRYNGEYQKRNLIEDASTYGWLTSEPEY